MTGKWKNAAIIFMINYVEYKFISAGLCTQVSSQYGCFLNYSDNFQSLVVPEKIQSGELVAVIL